MSGLSDDFWSDGLSDETPPVDLLGSYCQLLQDVFPGGVVEEAPGIPPAIKMFFGNHKVSLIGVYTGSTLPSEQQVVWRAYWHQMDAVHKGMSDPRGGRLTPSGLERSRKVIKSASGLGAWLSWVHRGICQMSCEALKGAFHPDTFMGDRGLITQAALTLHQVDAGWVDVRDYIIQDLPWKAGSLGSYGCDIHSSNEVVGVVSVHKRSNYWWYRVRVGNPSAWFSPLKVKGKLRCVTTDDWRAAARQCEQLYASNLFIWLMNQQDGAS